MNNSNVNKGILLGVASIILVVLLATGVITLRNALIANQTNNSSSSAMMNAEERVSIQIKLNNQGQENSYTYEAEKDSTAFDVLTSLSATSEEFDMQYSESESLGAYVNTFNNIAVDPNSQYWEFRVNGESSMVGISSYVVKDEDILEFILTTF